MLIYRPTIISGSGYYSGSFDGDGSRLYNLISSSYALTASYALNGGGGGGTGAGFPFSGTAVITGSLIVSGSLIDFSKVDYITGSSLIVNNITVLTSLTASGLNYPSVDGIAGQVIETDGAGNLFFGNIDTIVENVKNVSGRTLYKGTPVHATGSGTSGNIVGVIAASASRASTMPATFILAQTLTSGAEGLGIISGLIQGVNTSAFQNGQVIYVGANGGYTNVPPTGSNLIQNLGIVTKVHPTNGGGVVLGAGRANATPNLLNGQIFYGVNNRAVARPLRDVISGSIFSYTGSFAGDGSGLTNVFGQKGNKGEAVYYIYTSSLQGVLVNVNHNLDLEYPVYNIYDNLGNETIPKQFTIVDNNSVQIDFGIPFTGSLTISAGDKGLKGDKGNFKGEKGDKGDFKGSKGATGSKGAKGEVGLKGSQGITGTKGEKGLGGTIGATGAKGPAGEKGHKGDLGYKGEIGPKGQKGNIGPQGIKGNDSTVEGPKGSKGQKGEIGLQGSKGNASSVQGPKGSKGQKGEVGLQGTKGNASTVQGPKGDVGPKGDNGSIYNNMISGSIITLNHGLDNRYPVFAVYDITGSAVFPTSFVSVDENTSQVSFRNSFTGSISVMSGGQKGRKGEKGNFKGQKGRKGEKGFKGEGTLYTTSISGSIVTINHNTGNLFPIFTSYNKNKLAVQPKSVLAIDSNTLQVDFGTPFSGSISIGSGGRNGAKGVKGEKGNFKGEKGTKGQKGNDIFPFTGTAIITGSLNVSNSSSFSHILPKRDNFYDLGSPNRKWRDLYLTSASIYLGRTKITSSPEGRISFVDSQNPSQKILGNYTGSFTGSFNLPGVKQGSTENKVLLLDSKNNIIYRNNLSLTGSKGDKGDMGPSGSNAGIQTYTNPSNNRVITSVSSTEINAEANLTFDGSILAVNTTSGLKIPIGLTSERPASPSDGLIRLNTSLKSLEFFYNSAWANIMSSNMIVEYLVIAGGGGRGQVSIGGGTYNGGGGGAGGYKSSVYGEKSGGLLQGSTDIQMPLVIALGTPYEIIIGAGATTNSGAQGSPGNPGSPSSFYRILCNGGGGGGGGSQNNAGSGGSGGGMGTFFSFNGQSGGFPGSGFVSQGHNGDINYGGGAGGVGSITLQNSIESRITGTPIRRAAGGLNIDAVYAPNLGTGSGGGNGSGGWSGVVILRYSAALTLTNSTGGLTFSTNTIGNYKVTTFTEGAGNIEFNF